MPEFSPEESPSADGAETIFCESEDECGAGICVRSDGTFVNPCTGKGSCFCLSVPISSCLFSSCGLEEFCTDLSPVFTVCLPQVVVDSSNKLEPRPEFSPEEFPTFSEEPEITPDADFEFGLTGGTCGFDSDCQGSRSCMEVKMLGKECSRTGRCVCVPSEPTLCTSSAVCESGEVCAKSSAGGPTLCVSKRTVSTIEVLTEVTEI